ncbi:unnamed protein product [Linum trigynum]|uniref:Uncharacterized protein n=1 Tax=Linum trigynum TaxID=586398 RepID=A0AAV2D8K4_9ROSI
MCSETAPRLSFSRDPADDNESPTPEQQQWRRDANLLDHYSNPTTATLTPTADQPFEFSVSSNSGDQYSSSSADELFADGIILPFHRRHTTSSATTFNCSAAHRRAQSFDHPKLPPLAPLPPPSKKSAAPAPESEDQSRASSDHNQHQNQLQPSSSSKSFWGFKRSSSLNCDLKKTLICSLPPLLARSNSTGSVPPIPKKSIQKPDFHPTHKPIISHKQPSSSNSSSGYVYSFPQKPPLKRNPYGSSSSSSHHYPNGTARISPVLNVPISKGTANLFGFGTMLMGKEKKTRK